MDLKHMKGTEDNRESKKLKFKSDVTESSEKD